MNDVISTISNHKSIRRFTDKSIPEDTLATILKAAQYASTSSYVQAYHIIRITDDNLRATLAQLSGEQKYITTCSTFLVFCADLNKLDLACQKHSVKIDKGYIESTIVGIIDASLVAQNVMLAAESLGLGGVYIGGIRNNIEKVSALLKMPKQTLPLFGMCLGYPDQAPKQKPRLPLDINLSENTYPEISHQAFNVYDEITKAYYIERTKGKITHSWTEQMSEKLKKETRPFMKSYLDNQGLCLK